MKREILVRLDITGATDTHCSGCHLDGNCPLWTHDEIKKIREAYYRDLRHPGCMAAELSARESEGAK